MSKILKFVDSYSFLLQDASKWQSGDLIALEDDNIRNASDDFIYETFCYLFMAQDLGFNYSRELILGTGKFITSFPKKPANRKGKPFFRFYNKEKSQLLFEFCLGIKIQTNFAGISRAPDFSFLNPYSSETPSTEDIFMMADAKHNRLGSDDKLDLGQFYYVSGMVKDLNLNPIEVDLVPKFSSLSQIKNNFIITNASNFSNDIEYISSHGLQIIEDFSKGKQFNLLQ